MSGESSVVASQWRLVQVGRIILLNDGPNEGSLAAIIEIVDHKRVLIDAPNVPRQSIALKHVTLTNIVLKGLPRGAGTGALSKVWEKEGVESKWAETAWAKKRASRERRRELTDFERFKVMVLKKQRRFEVRKAAAKLRSTA